MTHTKPDCGRQFVSVNRNHSCGQYSLEAHFAGKNPNVREMYDSLLQTLERFGPGGVFPVKTRIVFQAEVQFAAAVPRTRWLDGYLWLRRQAAHPCIQKIEMGIYRDYGHLFRLNRPEDLVELLYEAYRLGCES
jgi:hypothetical protein